MKCDSCGTVVKDGTAVCPKCDAILDASAFESGPPEDVGPAKPRGSSTGVKKVKRTATGSGTPASASKKVNVSGSTGVKMMPAAPPRLLKPKPGEEREDIDWRQMSKDAVKAMGKQAEFKAEVSTATPEELMRETKSLFKSLSFSDKLSAGGGLGVVISCFFPWKETFDNGDSLGLMSLGAPVFFGGLAVLGAVVARVKNMMPKANPMMVWLTQFGSACFCVLWSLVFIKSAIDSTITTSPEGNMKMWASSPSMGVGLAIIFALVAVGGTLLGLREKPQR